jgi:hypothetical protein
MLDRQKYEAALLAEAEKIAAEIQSRVPELNRELAELNIRCDRIERELAGLVAVKEVISGPFQMYAGGGDIWRDKPK